MTRAAKSGIKRSTISAAGVAERKAQKLTSDSFQNIMLKLGMGTDNALSASTYGFNPITRVRTLLEWIYRGSWMGGLAVDIVADDMTRAGIDISSQMDPKQMDTLQRGVVGLNFWGKVNETIKWARLYGGCIMVPMIDGQDPSTPLRIETIARDQLKSFLVLDRWQVEARLEQLVGPEDPRVGEPMFYRVNSDAPALRGKNIHYSRVFRMLGVQLPYWQAVQENLWGLSVFERLYDRMVGLDSSTQGAAQAVYKSHLRIYQMKGMTDLLANGGDTGIATVMRKMEMMRRWQSNEGYTTIDAEDTISAVSNTSFAGISDVILQQAQQMSGTLQIPLVRFFGQSPAGLNASGESDLRTYYDGTNSKQERECRLPVMSMYRIMGQSLGVPLPTDFDFVFTPLWQLDEGQKSEIAARDATSVGDMVDRNIIDVTTALRELKQGSKTTSRFDNITDDMIKAAEAEPPSGLGEDLHSLGLSDDEYASAGMDPDKVKHPNPVKGGLEKIAAGEMPGASSSGGGTSKPSRASRQTPLTPTSDGSSNAANVGTVHLGKSGSGSSAACGHRGARITTSIKSFGDTPSADRCVNCQVIYQRKLDLAERNQQRRTYDSLPAYGVCGVQVSVENMVGSTRSGAGWSVVMPADYGHIAPVSSAEGDMEWMDAFVGPHRESEDAWIIDGIDPRSGEFDEHKCMLGFSTEEEALECFAAAYHDGAARRVGGITHMDREQFAAWLQSGDHTRPVKKS